MNDYSKDWCLDAAKREDGQEVGAGKLADDLGPIVHLRLELTKAQNEIERLRGENEHLRKSLEFIEGFTGTVGERPMTDRESLTWAKEMAHEALNRIDPVTGKALPEPPVE